MNETIPPSGLGTRPTVEASPTVVALAGTLAHLERLTNEGRVERLGGEVVSYRP